MTAIDSQSDRFQESPIYDAVANIARSRQITESEQAIFRQAFLETPLSEEEHRHINRLYRLLRRGKIELEPADSPNPLQAHYN
ncbi:MAG: hypothetical protein F6K32_24870 [Desertifilum sp. SIO1I2]|nr:hypothetical protein [Desertifilum sp. SIO1I2]